MKHHESRKPGRWAATVLFAGAVALATGCVEHQVEYVPTVQTPAAYQAPPPPAPPPVAPAPPPPAADIAAAPMPVAPPAPANVLRSGAELDRMLGPIALYPDPLIAQILPAATLPEQVVMADRYVRGGGDVTRIDTQPWDLSVKALARYPTVLQMMDDNLAWTTDLGQTFIKQPADVMDSIQRLRAQAQAAGNLQSTPQQTVVIDEGSIEIVPASPEIIYVPVYQPDVVYVRPPPFGGFWISFGAGFAVGTWLNHDCDWHHHDVIVWHHDHPRPRDWWYHPAGRGPRPVVVNQTVVVNNRPAGNPPYTVWHPQARPAVSGTGRMDRGWGPGETHPAPAPKPVQLPPIVKNAPPARPASEAHPAPRPGGARPGLPSPTETHPATIVREVHPAPAPKSPQPPSVMKEVRPVPAPKPAPPVAPLIEARPAPAPRPAPPVAAPPPAVRPVALPAVRPEPVPSRPGGVFSGIESAHVTRESSSRGQESREAMSRPAPPPPAHSSPPLASPPGQSGGDTKKH